MDHLRPAARSANMAKVKGKNTGPELLVRKALHAMGYRFRLHRRDLPGRPDIVLPRLRTVVFVHGCYWHRHADCNRASMPATRRDFWQAKFDRTVERDYTQGKRLAEAGWNVLVVWECETRNQMNLAASLREKLAMSGF
jgi:DNA mismatch endonuclease (patch repair protein)